MAIRRAKNDTSGIDILIICSMYYYSDKFDMNVFFDFEDIEINQTEYQNKKEIIDKIRVSWNKKIEQYMTEQLVNSKLNRTKKSIQDLFFTYDGIRYVKPPIQWGKTSEFWKNGRPREDTTTEEDLPIINVVPNFDEEVYLYLKKSILNDYVLQNSVDEYLKLMNENQVQSNNKIQIMVYIELFFDDMKNLIKPFDVNNLQELANIKYKILYKKIQDEITEYKGNVECDDFILVEIQEIGMDKANDIAYISHITNNTKQEYLIDGMRLKYDYAIASAISLCMVLKAKKVYLIHNEDFKWK